MDEVGLWPSMMSTVSIPSAVNTVNPVNTVNAVQKTTAARRRGSKVSELIESGRALALRDDFGEIIDNRKSEPKAIRC
jgi:hypothetical protein